MKYFKRIISGGLIGIGIGFVINLIFSIIKGSYSPGVPSFIAQFESEITAVAVLTITYMVLGILQEFSTTIMDNKERSLFVNTTMHFIVVVIPLLIAAYVLHWSREISGLVSVGIAISLAYLLIWTVNYFIIRSEIIRINHSLEKRNK